MVRGKTKTLYRARDEPGGVKAQTCPEPGRRGRTASTPSLVLGSALAFFPGHSLQELSLQAAPRHRRIAFAMEGSPLDRCHEWIIRASDALSNANRSLVKYLDPSP